MKNPKKIHDHITSGTNSYAQAGKDGVIISVADSYAMEPSYTKLVFVIHAFAYNPVIIAAASDVD